MATRSTHKLRRTTTVPSTTMGEPPVLDEEERAEFAASLKEAEAQIKAGKGAEYDPKAFRDRLVRIYRGKNR